MHTDDTATEPTCIRHNNRHGDPWCPPCADDIRAGILALPDLHTRLLHHDGIATRPRLIGGRTSIDPASPSPEYDHADEIAKTLAAWATAWADHLDDQVTREHSWADPVDDQPTLLPCCAAAADADQDADLQAHAGYCPWRRYVEARGRSDAERRGLTSKPITPRIAASYLNRHRRNTELLTSPLAEDLGNEIRSLHARALRLLGGDETSNEPVITNLQAALCPKCQSTATRREVDITRSGIRSDRVTCRHCDLNIDWDVFLAIQEHRHAQAGRIGRHVAQRHLADSHTAA